MSADPGWAVQKDGDRVNAFWNGTADWRVTYFQELCETPPECLSEALRNERAFVLGEEAALAEEVARSESVLELGCGVGRSLLAFISAHPRKSFVGVDLAERQIERFVEAISAGAHANAQAIVADASSLPLRDGQFDLILICNQTFGTFLGATRDGVLREAFRLLRPHGHLYVGGFDNVAAAADCYSAWSVPVEAIDSASGFVRLRDYNSWWQPEAELNDTLLAYGFELARGRRTYLGYTNTYRRLPIAPGR